MDNTFGNIAKNIRAAAREIEARKGAIGFLAAEGAEADMKKRIFQKGLDENEAEIGKYSTTPLYVSIANAKKELGGEVPVSNLRPKGKDGKSTFRSGRKKKSQYFPGGYREFRDTVNRQSKRVDLTLSRRLQNAIVTTRRGRNSVIRFNRSQEIEKAQRNSDRYGSVIFTITNKEADRIGEIWAREVGNILNKHLGKAN